MNRPILASEQMAPEVLTVVTNFHKDVVSEDDIKGVIEQYRREFHFILVDSPAEPELFQVGSASVSSNTIIPTQAAQSFVEQLLQQGNIDIQRNNVESFAAVGRDSLRKSHSLVEENGQLVLKRNYFDCRIQCKCGKSTHL